ncbi:MAG: hypothetical protein JW983_04980 [Elusimicrobia bacterium]|nr:hypothetical protein [Elusimicrobiota bacterium]
MKKLTLPITILAFIAIICFGIYWTIQFLKTDIFLSTEKKAYYHWEFVRISARIKNKKLFEEYKTKLLYVSVFKNKNKILTIGNLTKIPLKYNKTKMIWEGNWPCPWNAADGKYHVEPLIVEDIKYSAKKFFITRRKIKKSFNPGFGVLTFESATSVSKVKMKNPNGKTTNWMGMLDWTEFIGADAFWYLAGQTNAKTTNPDEHFPWVERNMSQIPEIGEEAHNRGLKFGAYIISFLTYGHRYKNYQYSYAYDSENGGPIKTRGISIADEKRVSDIIKLVKIFNERPEIDYIGLDYIRNTQGGYELVNEFVEEMNVRVPDRWEKFNGTQRIAWLANEKALRRDMNLIDQWQWWRAHKVSKIIKRITSEVNLKKPLWVFILTWEKGWQHGQDSVMFSDAGADIIALMLYEATRNQFDILLDEWHNYLKKGNANLLPGNVIDWPLHQKTLNPPGPEEFYTRIIDATKKIYNDSAAEGVFIHDLARALWGRTAPYTTKEWLLAGAAAITEMRRLNGLLPVAIEINIPEKVKIKEEFPISVVLKNTSYKKQKNLLIKPYLIGGTIINDEQNINELGPKKSKTITFKGIIKTPAWQKNLKNMAAVQVKNNNKNSTVFKYVTTK